MENKKPQEYKYPMINEGKPFILDGWTIRKHKEVLAKVAKLEEKAIDSGEKLSEDAKDELFQNALVMRGLKDIDSSFKEEQFEGMHPMDKSALFTAIYYAGREGIIVKEKVDAGKKQKTK